MKEHLPFMICCISILSVCTSLDTAAFSLVLLMRWIDKPETQNMQTYVVCDFSFEIAYTPAMTALSDVSMQMHMNSNLAHTMWGGTM